MTKDSDLTSSPVVSLANLSASQEKENQKKMTEISGKKLLELSKSPDLLFLLEKMLMESLNSISTPYSRIWKAKNTPQGALIFQLRASVQNTEEKEYGLFPTPTQDSASERTKKYKQGGTPLPMAVKMLPTPTVGCEEGGEQSERVELTKRGSFLLRKKNPNAKHKTFGAKLSDAMLYLEKQKMYPTPQRDDGKNVNPSPKRRMTLAKHIKMYPTPNTRDTRRGCNQKQLATEIDKEYPQAKKTGGRLNPNFVERLMGFPTDWTRIEQTGSKDSETQSVCQSHSTSDKS